MKKTKVYAEEGKQDIIITREFDLPVELLFKAHIEPELIVQWKVPQNTTAKIIKYAGKKHGSYEMHSFDTEGKKVSTVSGVIHDYIPNRKIVRTFEIDNAPIGVQLEIYDFEALTDNTSKLTIHVIYQSGAIRDKLYKTSPSGYTMDMAHDKMQELMNKLK